MNRIDYIVRIVLLLSIIFLLIISYEILVGIYRGDTKSSVYLINCDYKSLTVAVSLMIMTILSFIISETINKDKT